jgi:hypothetical protein
MLLGALLATFLSTEAARAQDASTGSASAKDAKPTSGWTFQITPYLWLAGLGGDVTTPGGRSASFDASIGDVLSHLDGGLMLLGEARHGRWGILADFDYAKLSSDHSSFNPLLGQPSVTLKEYLGTLVGGYRFIDSPGFKFDVMGGVRVMSISADLSFSGSILPPLSASGGDTWADPIFGLRAIVPLGSGFSANIYGDVGGGPNSDFTGQLYGGFGYAFNDTISAYVGYRYLTMHHTPSNLHFEISQQGPLIGLGIRF